MNTKDLLAKRSAIENDPNSREIGGGIYLYNKAARRKLDEIARDITENLRRDREAKGRPVVSDGYSEMKQNRR